MLSIDYERRVPSTADNLPSLCILLKPVCVIRDEGTIPMDGNSEVIHVEKPQNSCKLCDEYAVRHASKPMAVICCEGACLRGEIARRAADILCRDLAPEHTARICLGGAFTKKGGQRDLVQKAKHVVAVEGCHVLCASRMMKGVVEGLTPEIVIADRLCTFDRSLFGADELPDLEISAHARTVAQRIASESDAFVEGASRGCSWR